MSETRPWTFLSNHAHVLVAISQNPEVRLREIAALVGITERSASSIVSELESSGFLQRHKVGRNNRYLVTANSPLRHRLEEHRSVHDLLAFLQPPDSTSAPAPPFASRTAGSEQPEEIAIG
jgi:DNA-binding MarR family transcriptional regulator